MISYRSDGSNNKKLGTAFENEAVSLLAKLGYWAHFISPDKKGAQPFDIIAVKDGNALAIDCKTSATKWFNISRLEDNQILAFNRWLRCGNLTPIVMVEYRDYIYCIDYIILKDMKSVNLAEWKHITALQTEVNREKKNMENLDNCNSSDDDDGKHESKCKKARG